jgi:hypothetical protein
VVVAVTMEVIARCKREILERIERLIRVMEETPQEYVHIMQDEFMVTVDRKLYQLHKYLYIARSQNRKESES